MAASRVLLRLRYARMQVFVVDIVWDNDERYEIVRRYSEFFSLQVRATILPVHVQHARSKPEEARRQPLFASGAGVAEVRLSGRGTRRE